MSIRGGSVGGAGPSVAACVALVLALMLASVVAGGGRAAAQDLEAQALQVERQLLCPQCTNVRLDQCELAICEDMRVEIRERLAVGHTPDDILLFFSGRFGDRVLADLPRSGFNLVLFVWVGGSIAFVLAAGTATLWRLRRTATLGVAHAGEGVFDAADERWLDEQLCGSRGGGPA